MYTHLLDSAPSGRWAVIWRWLKHREWALHVTELHTWTGVGCHMAQLLCDDYYLCLLICKDPAAPIDLFHCNQYSVTACSRKSSDTEAEEMKNMNQSSPCPQRAYVQVTRPKAKTSNAIKRYKLSSVLVLRSRDGQILSWETDALPCWLSAGRGGHTGMLGAGRGLSA